MIQCACYINQACMPLPQQITCARAANSISTISSKIASHEKLDPQKFSAYTYVECTSVINVKDRME